MQHESAFDAFVAFHSLYRIDRIDRIDRVDCNAELVEQFEREEAFVCSTLAIGVTRRGGRRGGSVTVRHVGSEKKMMIHHLSLSLSLVATAETARIRRS